VVQIESASKEEVGERPPEKTSGFRMPTPGAAFDEHDLDHACDLFLGGDEPTAD
jgi:hypothetical protein